jgi:hypothetical protein
MLHLRWPLMYRLLVSDGFRRPRHSSPLLWCASPVLRDAVVSCVCAAVADGAEHAVVMAIRRPNQLCTSACGECRVVRS